MMLYSLLMLILLTRFVLKFIDTSIHSSLAFHLQKIRQQILELLGPISMNHGAHFMAAIAYVWNERKQIKTPVRNKVGDDDKSFSPLN